MGVSAVANRRIMGLDPGSAWRGRAGWWENGSVDGRKLVIGMVTGAILLVLIFQGLNQFSS